MATVQKKQNDATSGMTLQRKKVIWAYIFLAIPIIFFLYIRIYPTLFAFNMSLYDYNPLALEQPYVGLDNYAEIIEEVSKKKSTTKAAFSNTFEYVALGVPIQLILSLGIALLLNNIRRFSWFYRLLFFLPFVTSTIAIAWVFRMLYEPQFGMFRILMDAFSIPLQPRMFIHNPQQALPAVLAMVIWQGMGFAVIIFLAGLKQIPRTYYDAAEVDGANAWQSFWKITLPLLSPSIIYLLVLQTISFLRMFAPVLAMTNGGPLDSTTTVVLRVYREAFQGQSMGYASALTVTLFGIILSITVIQLTITSRIKTS